MGERKDVQGSQGTEKGGFQSGRTVAHLLSTATPRSLEPPGVPQAVAWVIFLAQEMNFSLGSHARVRFLLRGRQQSRRVTGHVTVFRVQAAPGLVCWSMGWGWGCSIELTMNSSVF